MALTPEQLQTLNEFIEADPAMSGKPMNSDGDYDIAVMLNAAFAPTFYVWRSAVRTADLMLGGFDWTRVDNLTVGKARIWEWMTDYQTIDPSAPNVRAGVEATFSVEAGDAPNRMSVYSQSQRAASVVEQLFATGAGTTTTNHGIGPATMGFEGPINYHEVSAARALG